MTNERATDDTEVVNLTNCIFIFSQYNCTLVKHLNRFLLWTSVVK